jgi:hypothetical protein
VLAESPKNPVRLQAESATAVDLFLQGGDAVRGRLVNQNGQPLPNVIVSMLQHGSVRQQTVTDEQGWFRLSGLSPGQYQVAAANAMVVCRVWTEAARPPSAQDAVLLVTSDTVRGNWLDGIDRATIALGLSTGALVTSIVLPLVLNDNGEAGGLDVDVASP